MDWEEASYREGCSHARERAIARLRALDDELLRCKPNGRTVLGFRERTMVTRFGDVVVSRRMYRDSDGRTVFDLDDYLGWKPRQLASPSITQSVVEMATEISFRTMPICCRMILVSVISSLLRNIKMEILPNQLGRVEVEARMEWYFGDDTSTLVRRIEKLEVNVTGDEPTPASMATPTTAQTFTPVSAPPISDARACIKSCGNCLQVV